MSLITRNIVDENLTINNKEEFLKRVPFKATFDKLLLHMKDLRAKLLIVLLHARETRNI